MSNSILILISIIAYGIGAVFYKLATNHVHPIMTSAVMVGLYLILLPIAFTYFKVNSSISSLGFWFSLIGGACTCIGTITYMFALKGSGAGQLAAAVSVYPVITVLISTLFLDEAFSLKKGIGCLFAVASVFLLTMK